LCSESTGGVQLRETVAQKPSAENVRGFTPESGVTPADATQMFGGGGGRKVRG